MLDADRSQCAEMLIKNGGANVHAEDNTGRTAMSHAAKYGSIDCLNLLGNVHADVFHKDNEGKTPLQIAEASSRSEAVIALKRAQGVQSSSAAHASHQLQCLSVHMQTFYCHPSVTQNLLEDNTLGHIYMLRQ